MLYGHSIIPKRLRPIEEFTRTDILQLSVSTDDLIEL